MNLKAIKLISSFVVSTGVGSVVGNAVRRSTPEDISLFKKVSIGVGGFVLSSMVGNMAVAYVESTIDQTIDQIKEATGRKNVPVEDVDSSTES